MEKHLFNYVNVENKDRFENKHLLKPQWTFWLLISGNSGCNKTKLLLELDFRLNILSKVYLYANNLEEDKYKDLMLNMNVLREWMCWDMDLLVVSNDKSDIIDIDDLSPIVKI